MVISLSYGHGSNASHTEKITNDAFKNACNVNQGSLNKHMNIENQISTLLHNKKAK